MDSILFYPSVLIFILFFIFDITVSKSISISTLIMMVVVFIVLLPSKPQDDGYIWLFALIGVLVSFFAEFFLLNKNKKMAVDMSYERVNLNVVILGVLGLGLYLIQAMSIVFESGGFIDALTRARVDSYLKGGVLESSVVKVASYLLLPFTIMTIGIYFLKPSKIGFYVSMAIMVFYLLLVAETRLPLLFLILTPYYIWFFKLNLVDRFIVLCVLGPIGLFMLVLYVNLGALLRSGVAYDLSIEKLMNNSSFVEQMGYREWISDVVRYVDVHGVDYGWQWFIASWLNFVPRFVWEDKPITSTSNRLHEEVGGMMLGDGNYITTYTIFGEGYHQFGYIGVALSPIFFVALFYYSKWLVRNFKGNEFFMVWMLFRFIPFIRAEQPFFLVMVFALEIFLIQFMSRLKWK